MTNLDNIKAVLELAEENPTLPIKIKVEGDIFSDDCNAWFLADVGISYVSDYWEPDGEHVYIEDQIVDEIGCVYEGQYSDTNEIEFIDAKYDELKAAGEIKTAIFLEIVV